MSWFTPTHTHRHRQSTQKGFLLFFIFDYCAIYQLTFYKFQSPRADYTDYTTQFTF